MSLGLQWGFKGGETAWDGCSRNRVASAVRRRPRPTPAALASGDARPGERFQFAANRFQNRSRHPSAGARLRNGVGLAEPAVERAALADLIGELCRLEWNGAHDVGM